MLCPAILAPTHVIFLFGYLHNHFVATCACTNFFSLDQKVYKRTFITSEGEENEKNNLNSQYTIISICSTPLPAPLFLWLYAHNFKTQKKVVCIQNLKKQTSSLTQYLTLKQIKGLLITKQATFQIPVLYVRDFEILHLSYVAGRRMQTKN